MALNSAKRATFYIRGKFSLFVSYAVHFSDACKNTPLGDQLQRKRDFLRISLFAVAQAVDLLIDPQYAYELYPTSGGEA